MRDAARVRWRLLSVFAVVLLVLAGACSGAEVEPEDDVGSETGGVSEQAVDAIMAEHVGDDQPGGAVLVLQAGEVVHAKGYGLARVDDERANTPQTIFHLASAGKQMTGVAIMMLANEGELDYDDPVGQHVEELEPLGPEVTIRRLLQHTAAVPEVYEELRERVDTPTNEDLLPVLAESELDGEPGDAEEYSNVGYDVLGSVVERVSGQPFEVFMAERIFEPLEMDSTFSVPDAEGLANPVRAIGYEKTDDGFEVNDSDPLDGLRGAGSVYTTLDDIAKYDRALDGDALLPQDVMAEAFTPGALNDGSELDYGFGWELAEHEGKRYAGHSGGWVGYSTYYLRFPDDQLTIVVLGNRDDLEAEAIAFAVADLY